MCISRQLTSERKLSRKKINLVFALFFFTQADLIAYNRINNNLYRHKNSVRTYHTKAIIPITDVEQMKTVLNFLRHKNYKRAAAEMAKLEFAHLLKNSDAKSERLEKFLASSKRS